MKEIKFFRCEHCGNIIIKVTDGGPAVMCCGQKMTEIVADSVDAAAEKHVPVIGIEGNFVTVKVGDVPHPMLEEHFIEWICLHTTKGIQIAWLEPGQAPEAFFALGEGAEVVEAFAYCNLHGLWVSA